MQCNEAFSKSEDLLGEGFAGTNVIAIRLEALGDPNEGSEDESLLRRKRQSSSDLDSESAEPESTESSDLDSNSDSESGNTNSTQGPTTQAPTTTTTTTTTTTKPVRNDIFCFNDIHSWTLKYTHSRFYDINLGSFTRDY